MAGGWRWAALCAAIWAAACGDGKQQVHAVPDTITVSPSGLDFGDVALGREDSLDVFVRNDGLATTTVRALPGTPAGPDFAVAGLPVTLRPGESAKVTASFRPSALGAATNDLQLTADAAQRNPQVALKGNAVLGLAQIDPDSIDFGDVVVGESSSAPIRFTNNDGKARTDVDVQGVSGADAAAFSVSPSGVLTLDAEQSTTISVRFSPARLGPFQATLNVVPCPTCSVHPVVLSGNGVVRLLDVQPPKLDFGNVLLAASKTLPFSIRNTSKGPLGVRSIVPPGGDFSVALDGSPALPLTLAPDQTITGTATFNPKSLGQAIATAQFAASDGAPGLLDLAGFGYGPVLHVQPDALHLVAAALGTARPVKITATNVGLDPTNAAPLVVTAITVRATDPASWSITSPSLPWTVGEPGASGAFSLVYQPRSEGFTDATVIVSSNDALHPTVEIPVHALGRQLPPCSIRIMPGNPVDFGRSAILDPTVQGFELYNDGTDDCIFGDPDIVAGGPAFRWPGNVAPQGRQVPPGGRMSVRIEFAPETAGDYTGRVAFYMSDPSKQTVFVDLRGTGDDGCFFVTPGTVDFGGTQVGCGLPQQFAYAVNHCSFPVKVTAASVTPSPFSIVQIPPLPVTVLPNTNVPIGLNYNASSLGDDVASLLVTAETRPTPFQVGLTAGVVPADQLTDLWEQSTPKVDLLFVIDNSGSMAEEQAALAKNLDRLWNRIAIAKADFHIAVTTTGMDSYSAGYAQCPGGAQGGEAGRFFPVDGSRPRILTPATPDVKNALFANTNVGICHWDERFFDPVVAALTPPLSVATKAPGTPFPADGNAGFLRDDARLSLLAVSDADDANDLVTPATVAEYVAKIAAVKKGARDLVSFAGIVPLHLCGTVESVGTRYEETARILNGKLYDICDLNNFGAMLDDALGSLLLPLTSFKLSAAPRDPAHIDVRVNGAPASGWSFDATTNRIVFTQGSVPPPGSQITAGFDPACH
jgi:Abnormal spindle-like microcephaly-assoc'd, ASPM-SPD-2-Hydin